MPENPIVLLTRPVADSRRFARLLGESAEVVISPAFEVRQLDVELDLDEYCALIFSSQNAVRSLAATQGLNGRKAFTVGDRTADMATKLGMDAVSAHGNAVDLIALIKSVIQTGKVLHIRGARTRGNIQERLTSAGIETDSVVVYEQIPTALTNQAKQILASNRSIVIPVFSPHSAELLSGALSGTTVNAELLVIAMSDAVSRGWAGPKPGTIFVAAQPSLQEMLKETLRWVR